MDDLIAEINNENEEHEGRTHIDLQIGGKNRTTKEDFPHRFA